MSEETLGKINEARYYKAEEHITKTFPEAEELANKLFEPYFDSKLGGERTTAKAKVRIRRQEKQNGLGEAFRVVLSKAIPVTKKSSKGTKDVNDGGTEDNTTEEASGGAEDRPQSKAEDQSGGVKKKSAKRRARELSANRKAKS
jgi:hypothetical protein